MYYVSKFFLFSFLFRLLQFVFKGDEIIFPRDPLGPNGPTLEDFLKYWKQKKKVLENLFSHKKMDSTAW